MEKLHLKLCRLVNANSATALQIIKLSAQRKNGIDGKKQVKLLSRVADSSRDSRHNTGRQNSDKL